MYFHELNIFNMKSIYSFPAILFLILVSIVSCKKSSDDLPAPIPQQTIDVALKINESYRYIIGSSYGGPSVNIAVQAKHFLTSGISFSWDGASYEYTPAQNYTGTD